MKKMQRLTRLSTANLVILLLWTFGLIGAGAGVADALVIRVTPSVLNVESTTAEVNGRSLLGGSAGDQFTLGYTVEKPGAADILSLFTSIVFDPSALRFVGGFSFPIFETSVPMSPFDAFFSLEPIRDPEPRVTSPADTLIGLSHIARPFGLEFFPSNAIGPELAIAVTFEILDPDLLSAINMVFLTGDAAIVNGVSYCGGSSDSCDVTSDAIFAFKNFKVGPRYDSKASTPVPEPTSALLIGLGLAGTSRRAPVNVLHDRGSLR